MRRRAEDRRSAARDRQRELAARLRDAERALQALTDDGIDAVVDESGGTFLLRRAQDELRRTEAASRTLAQTQQAILDALPAMVVLLDAEGTIVSVNATWYRTVGSDRPAEAGAWVGANYLRVCDRAEGAESGEAALVADGIRAVLAGRTPQFVHEYRCPAPDGEHWFRLVVSPVGLPVPTGAVVMHLDITDARRAAEERRRHEALLAMASQLSRVGAWVVEVPTMEVTWSSELRAMLGWTAAAPTLEASFDVWSPQSRESLREAFAACVRDGTPYDLELQLRPGTDSHVRWMHAVGRAERDESGRVCRVHGALQDISDRKQLEHQFLRAQRMQGIGTLAGGIAHDLNNVLAPVVLTLDFLRMEAADAEQAEMLDTAVASARRGADMIRQLLAFARGVEGERLPVQADELVRDMLRVTAETFPKNITVEAHVAPRLAAVLGDATQLHQVLLNLCVNARDAMPDGGRLILSAANGHGAAAGDHPTTVEIAVQDTGSGMPPDVLEQIFDPFFTTKAQGKGTGLGLSTSLAIVRQHGGELLVRSEPGAGTTFTVRLPAILPDARRAAPPAAADLPRGRGELLLVVDDEAAVRQLMRQTLETFGYRVRCAADGREGLDAFTRGRGEIAAVLTDLMMPEMDGIALIGRLLALDPQVRILAFSGLETAASIPQPRGRAPIEVLPKPFSSPVLLRGVRTLLDGQPC